MDVERAARGDPEYRLGQDQPIGGDDQRFRPGCRDPLVRLGVLQMLRLEHGQAVLQSKALDCAFARSQPPAGWPVGLRENEGNFMPGIVQRGQSLGREVRSASEC